MKNREGRVTLNPATGKLVVMQKTRSGKLKTVLKTICNRVDSMQASIEMLTANPKFGEAAGGDRFVQFTVTLRFTDPAVEDGYESNIDAIRSRVLIKVGTMTEAQLNTDQGMLDLGSWIRDMANGVIGGGITEVSIPYLIFK